MIHLRPARERRLDEEPVPEVWHTFHAGLDLHTPHRDHFHVLEVLDEVRLPPGKALPPRPHRRLEWVTFVVEGGLSYEDATGRAGELRAGEVRRIAVDPVHHHHERNASTTDWVHFFELGLHPPKKLTAGNESRRFTVADRRGLLCLVASPLVSEGTLHLDQDARVYSSRLDVGQHVVHELLPGRVAWVHLVRGEASLNGVVMSTGDGAAVSEERSVSLTAAVGSDALIIEVAGANGHER